MREMREVTGCAKESVTGKNLIGREREKMLMLGLNTTLDSFKFESVLNLSWTEDVTSRNPIMEILKFDPKLLQNVGVSRNSNTMLVPTEANFIVFRKCE